MVRLTLPAGGSAVVALLVALVALAAAAHAAPDAAATTDDAAATTGQAPSVAHETPAVTPPATRVPLPIDAAVKAVLEQRLLGDRTGACVAAAVVGKTVSRAFVCADRAQARPLDTHTAFEIGSVTKTMTSFLLADLIDRGQLSLDDTLAQHLPPGTKVPAFSRQGPGTPAGTSTSGVTPIRLKHLVTHTSGLPALPARMGAVDQSNPYAALTEATLLASLGDVALTGAPGTHWAYSNFAAMLLSVVVSRTAGSDFESLLAERLFRPLGMRDAHITKAPKGVRDAVGHLPTGAETHAWDVSVDLAGAGGVRASLDDMVRYAQAQMGAVGRLAGIDKIDGIEGPRARATALAHVASLMAKTQQPVDLGDAHTGGPRMGMGWVLASHGGQTIAVHEGGTGGFSAFVAIARGTGPDDARAVVILSDTAIHSVGGLGDLGLHLLDPTVPLRSPRRRLPPDIELVRALAGRYHLDGHLGVTLTERAGTLFLRADGQREVELAFDSQGDFYPLTFDALLTPLHAPGGGRTFAWTQGGGRSAAVRDVPARDAHAHPSADAGTSAPARVNVADYAGIYQLLPAFSLTVAGAAGQLTVQGTGQPALPVDAAGKDVFVAASVGAELTFERDAAGRVDAVTLRQSGQALRGRRAPR